MTVIAWDGRTLAADKRSTFDGYPATTTKIVRAPNGDLIGAGGNSGMCRELRQWWIGGGSPANYPDKDGRCVLLVVQAPGRVLYFESGPAPVLIEQRHFAVGSGRDLAIAAMFLGCHAYRAVEIACLFNAGCGNGIDTLEFERA